MDDGARERLTRGRDHYQAGEYEQAEGYLAELAAGDAPFADVFDMLGVIYHQQGRMQEAQQMFERALAINPNYTEAALNLAVTYNDLGKYKEANALYARVMELSKNAPRQLDPFAKGKLANMHADLGAAYRDLGLTGDAIREYEKALALCPTFHDIRTRLGSTLREAGNLDAAAREIGRLIYPRACIWGWCITARAATPRRWRSGKRSRPSNRGTNRPRCIWRWWARNPTCPTSPAPVETSRRRQIWALIETERGRTRHEDRAAEVNDALFFLTLTTLFKRH